MRSRPFETIALLTIATLCTGHAVRAEVYAEVDPQGQFSGTKVVLTGRAGRVWEPAGAAAVSTHVLNPNGDLLGDGAPAIALNPTTGLPRAVWSSRGVRGLQIVSSTFDGQRWSRPLPILAPGLYDALDPKITFNPAGVAIVVWWERAPSPVVKMSYLMPSGIGWTDGGTISAQGEKAKDPALLQSDATTIIAYRTPNGIRIVTRSIASSTFGDGPTPFPHSDPKLP